MAGGFFTSEPPGKPPCGALNNSSSCRGSMTPSSAHMGNGSPLPCSCLKNPMDREAWQDGVHGVAKSWTWLKQLRTQSSAPTEGELQRAGMKSSLDFPMSYNYSRSESIYKHRSARNLTLFHFISYNLNLIPRVRGSRKFSFRSDQAPTPHHRQNWGGLPSDHCALSYKLPVPLMSVNSAFQPCLRNEGHCPAGKLGSVWSCPLRFGHTVFPLLTDAPVPNLRPPGSGEVAHQRPCILPFPSIYSWVWALGKKGRNIIFKKCLLPALHV